MQYKLNRLVCFLLLIALSLGIGIRVNAESEIETETEIQVTVTPVPAKSGWETTSAGKKFYVNGKAMTGLSVIKGKTYVFNSKGILQISKWTLIGGKKYCSNSKGILVRNKLVKRNGNFYYVKADGTALRNAWKTLSNGKICYFGSKGTRLTGIHKIGNITYALSANSGYLMRNKWVIKGSKVYRTNAKGVIQKNTLMKINGNEYFFDSKGVRYQNKWKTFKDGKAYFTAKGCRAFGEVKIGKTLYFFNSKGYLVTGKTTATSGDMTYYLDGNGVVEMKKKQTGSAYLYYNPSGSVMSNVQVDEYMTLVTARRIAAENTNASMSDEEKLLACFKWVAVKYYRDRRRFSNFEGWPTVYANDIYTYGNGDCHSFASAFAYLAKALGYKNIYVCTDAPGNHGEGHSWCEINGKVYDPLFADGRKDYVTYYAGSYAAYILRPVLHIAI